MLAKKSFSKLFAKRTDTGWDNYAKLNLEVEMSFKANAQVSYKDENGYVKIKRFCAKNWGTDIKKPKNNLNSPIELKVFIYTPNLIRDEEVKLSISMDNRLLEEKVFIVPMDNEYAGWFGLNHIPQIELV